MNKNTAGLRLVKETFLKDLVIVTGCPASGKSLLAPIVGSLKRAENFKMSILLEHLGTLNHLGKLSDEVMTFLLRYSVDFMLYDNLIGRNMNFRFTDETSIWNSGNPQIYFDRLLVERGEYIIDKMEKERPLLILALSDVLWHARRWFEAFPFLKIIYSSRHPIDMVYSWYNHRYGEEVKKNVESGGIGMTYGTEIYNSKINQVLLTQIKDHVVPYYALDFEVQYSSMSEMDRVIYMIHKIRGHYLKALESLSAEQKKNILFLRFDEIAVDTSNSLNKICSFLDTESTFYTVEVLQREKCPRVIDSTDRKNKLDKIQDIASERALDVMSDMINDYEKSGI